MLGPLYGGLILTVASWQTIFWLNLPIAGRIERRAVRGRSRGPSALRPPPGPTLDPVSIVLAVLALGAGCLAIVAPDPLRSDATAGLAYTALGGLVWLTPLAIVAAGAAVVLILWDLRGTRSTRPLIAVQRIPAVAAAVDWPGAALLALALASVIVSFAAEDPTTGAVSPAAVWLLPLGALSVVLFLFRERRAPHPLVAAGELSSPGAYGALLANLAVGSALMAALLDVPILARATVFPNSQLGAALVLLRFLIGLPLGAVLGGWLSQRVGNRAIAAAGMALAAAAFGVMTTWTATTLGDRLGPGWLHPSDPVLFVCGLGFGIAIAPVNASMLVSVRERMHGLASALVVVARMIGMLVGISILTAVSLHVFYTTTATLPSPQTLCPASPLNCPGYQREVTGAIITELRTVFLGAGVSAAVAAVFAALLLRGGPARLRPVTP